MSGQIKEGAMWFVDENGQHQIPKDGQIFECDFCAKKFFIPTEAMREHFGPGGSGCYCSRTCSDWFQGIRNGTVDLNKDVPADTSL